MESIIKIRVDETDKAALALAAKEAGLSLSGWARERLKGAAIREAKERAETLASGAWAQKQTQDMLDFMAEFGSPVTNERMRNPTYLWGKFGEWKAKRDRAKKRGSK